MIKSPQISQDYDPIVQNVIALPESPAKVFIKLKSAEKSNQIKQVNLKLHKIDNQ